VQISFLSWRDINDPASGGSELLVNRVATELVERGHSVTVLTGGGASAQRYRSIQNGGRFTQYLTAPFHGAALRGSDLVIDVSNGVPYLVPLWHRGPVACLVHHIHDQQWFGALPRPMSDIGRQVELRLVPRFYRRFISVSPSTTEGLIGLGVDKCRIREIRNGVDMPRVDPNDAVATSTEPLFVTVGRLVPHKGVDRVLAAWAKVQPQIGGRLVVIGDGPLRDELERSAPPAVEFTGYLPDEERDRLVASAWAMVHGAHHEGWGIVVLEAGSHRVPTLGFDVPGVRDSVVHGSTGLLATDIDGLVANWLELATSEFLRSDLARQAYKHAATFSWEHAAELIEDYATEARSGLW
jgi:glycosyltransferase involved in cell wall biosynthesis